MDGEEGITSSWSDKTTAGPISSLAARATGKEERENKRSLVTLW